MSTDDNGKALVWISGASGGIGRALVRSLPWPQARVIGISRHGASDGIEHLQADLSDPASWARVARCFHDAVAGFDGGRIVFVQAAGTVDPIGYAGAVDTQRYVENVLLNGAATQVLGHLFIEAVRAIGARRHLMMITSGAARSVYPGWSSYGAAKAGVDQWVRDVGAEQGARGVQVLSVAPGTVNTPMQEQLRATTEAAFPQRQKFVDLFDQGKLSDPDLVARRMWRLIDEEHENGSVLDLRQLPA